MGDLWFIVCFFFFFFFFSLLFSLLSFTFFVFSFSIMYILCKCYSIYGIPVIVYYVVYVTWKPAIKILLLVTTVMIMKGIKMVAGLICSPHSVHGLAPFKLSLCGFGIYTGLALAGLNPSDLWLNPWILCHFLCLMVSLQGVVSYDYSHMHQLNSIVLPYKPMRSFCKLSVCITCINDALVCSIRH